MKKVFCLSLFSILFCVFASAEETVTPTATPTPSEQSTWDKTKDLSIDAYKYSKEKVSQAGSALDATRANREKHQWLMTFNYSIFETWVMSKYGVTAAYNSSPESTFEFEYMRGSIGFSAFNIDIGEIKEQRFSFLWRSYAMRNSFNFILGAFYNRFDVKLGDDMLATVTSNPDFSYDMIKLSTLGLTWGLGNRWHMNNGIIWGFDWFTVNVPLTVMNQETPFLDETSSEQSRKDVNNALKIFKHVPAVAVAKVQFSYSF